jgi:hypothetical protein
MRRRRGEPGLNLDARASGGGAVTRGRRVRLERRTGVRCSFL